MPNGWTRAPSLIAGLAVSALLMLYPYALGTQLSPTAHAGLPLLLLGVCGALIHGIGYQPDHRILRIFFSPLVSWPLMAIGAAVLAIAEVRY